jgi:hypothetical protein
MYRIADWNVHFEINRSRETKAMKWVAIPNKLDGDGYTELICDHDHGAAHYGVWCALVLVASKCSPRGTLIRESGKPHDIKSLARITRMPAALIAEAIDRLTGSIGWLECVPDPVPSQDVASKPADTLQKPAPQVRQGRTDGAGSAQSRRSFSTHRTGQDITMNISADSAETAAPSHADDGQEEVQDDPMATAERVHGLAVQMDRAIPRGQERERKLLAMLAYLVASGDLDPVVVREAIDSMRHVRPKPINPMAYLRSVLENKLTRAKFRYLLALVPPPGDPRMDRRATTRTRPHAAAC